jgi:hypothetical protein
MKYKVGMVGSDYGSAVQNWNCRSRFCAIPIPVLKSNLAFLPVFRDVYHFKNIRNSEFTGLGTYNQ